MNKKTKLLSLMMGGFRGKFGDKYSGILVFIIPIDAFKQSFILKYRNQTPVPFSAKEEKTQEIINKIEQQKQKITRKKAPEISKDGIVGGDVVVETKAPVRAAKSPKLIKEIKPVYPKIARRVRMKGVVILEVTTDFKGRVRRLKILKSIPLLDQSAMDAVKQWIYEPMIIEGKPRGAIFTVRVPFILKK